MKFDKKSSTEKPGNGKSMVVRSRAELTVFRFTPDAVRLQGEALQAAAAVTEVKDAAQQKVAVGAQLTIAEVLKLGKTAWEEAKRPIIDYRRKMDDAAKAFIGPLEAEQLRLARAVGDFQSLELAKQRAAQQAENERLSKLERERAAELAKADSIEAVDDIQQVYNDRAKAEAPAVPVEPVRVGGQVVKDDWAFEVTDIWMLARAHPGCVKIEPRASEIKSLLSAGVAVAGVRAWREVKGTVRLGQAINV